MKDDAHLKENLLKTLKSIDKWLMFLNHNGIDLTAHSKLVINCHKAILSETSDNIRQELSGINSQLKKLTQAIERLCESRE